MNKSAFARDLSARLGARISRQMLDKYHTRGMPINSVDSAIHWLHMNTVGEPGQRAEQLIKGDAIQVATSPPPGATPQPAPDWCGARIPDEFLAELGADFYVENLAAADIVALAGALQEEVPELAQLPPATAEAVRRAIREVTCKWTGGQACPYCRRTAGVADPPEPDDELEARTATMMEVQSAPRSAP